MAILIPNPMTGRDVAQVLLTSQTVTSAGVLTDSVVNTFGQSTGDPYAGSPTDLVITVSLLAQINFSLDARTQDMSSINRLQAHHVRVGIGAGFVVTEILRKGTNTQLLAALYYNAPSRYLKVQYARSGNFWTLYGLMEDLRQEQQLGQNTAELVLGPVGIAPAYSTGVRAV